MNQLQSKSAHRKGLEKVIDELKEAKSFAREDRLTKLLARADALAGSAEGIRSLFERIDDLDAAGIFYGTVWENPARLVPSLVNGTLKSGHPLSTLEVLSELRMLGIAAGRNTVHHNVDSREALEFLEQVIVHNLDLIFGEETEEMRTTVSDKERLKASNLFELIVEVIPIEAVKERLAEEVDMLCAQRPIVTRKVREILELVRRRLTLRPDDELDRRLQYYIGAINGPTFNTVKYRKPEEYQAFLEQSDREQVAWECEQCAAAMRRTGLVSPHHAILLRHVYRFDPRLLVDALGVSGSGRAELLGNLSFVQQLIDTAVTPKTAQAIFGLMRVLERGLLSRRPVENGLIRLISLDIHPAVVKKLEKRQGEEGVAPVASLLAGVLTVLGQPLGVRQGMNPTCQAARGISLWSQHAPGKLLNMVITAATTNNLEFSFEGQMLRSSRLSLGLAKDFDYNLDAVSVVLVPHLDRIYNEMMRRATGRGEDPHKWVNPALYGQWIQTGFISAYNYQTLSIRNYDRFVRTFTAAFHPRYNGGFDLVYPNPVGIFITSASGNLLGFHAVSLLRVAENDDGEVRAYFLNPNNEGRQDWGQGIRPSVQGRGEKPGESSLPFNQFVARLYAFHYNSLSISNRNAIPASEVALVRRLAKGSWGASYIWN